MKRVKFKMVGKYTGIGLEDFQEVIEKENIYFDKTLLIKEILDSRTKVTLFTRPRRFGKTLTLSMIENFFNIRKKEENKNLFKNLKIMDTEYADRQGSNPVIYISFKDIKGDTPESIKQGIKNNILNYISAYYELFKDLNPIDKKYLDKLLEYNEEHFKTSIKFITKIFYQYYGKKVIVLIDEYDTPLVSAFSNGIYDEVKDFIAAIYASTLKGNEYLEFAVITGILKVAKEGIFSSLNNLEVNTIFTDKFSDYFGFTHQEIKDVLKLFKIEDKYEELCKWYDGYSFGSSKIFNPWSIIYYLYEKQLKPYWVNTASDELIVSLFKRLRPKNYEKLLELVEGKEIEVTVFESVSLDVVNNPDNIWLLLLYAGYLTVSEKVEYEKYKIRMVNMEIAKTIEKRFFQVSYGSYDTSELNKMLDLFFADKIYLFQKRLNYLTKMNYSYYDFQTEASYKMYFMTLLRVLRRDYIIESEIESGTGRVDLLFYKENEGYLLEFKKADDIEKALIEAKEQVKEKEYELRFKKYGITNYKVYIVIGKGKEIRFEEIR